MNFEYSIPEIKEEPGKPYSFPNQSFPYSSLPNDRRFEELIYSIYKQEIENNSFPPYDKIQILKGIKDKGRDCSLHTKGKNTGLIQCKWYTSRLEKSECIKEIIKFILYYIIDNSLITEISYFTYYFAAANGFSDDTQNLFLNFNSEVLKEPKLKEWTTSILEKPSFKNIKEENRTFEILNEILGKIKVIPINPQDLDLHLSQPYNTNIIPLFFEVRTAFISNPDYKKPYSDKSQIPIPNILKQLKNASNSLSTCKNYFEGYLDSNVPREETQQLYNWIITPLKLESDNNYKNTILLAGNAGCGKTVILKDLYTKLIENNIPILGLKADKLYVSSIKELQNKINIEDSIYKMLNSLKESYSTLVIVIDQIDALSQSLSAKRDYMDTYIQLIDSLSNDVSVRIVLSIRIFDLNYDPSLRLYKNNSSILVQPLTNAQVDRVLQKLGITENSITPELFKLLKTPNRLDIFCRIYKHGKSYLSIKNIQDLYLELWKLKVLDIVLAKGIDSQRVIKLLFSIAESMYELQKISIPATLFIDTYYKELNYLQSENLIKIEDNQIQFFHQTFYDYVFAKQFIESGNSVISYLKRNQQSIYIRSCYKMLINYLYLYDFKKYAKIIKHILLSKKFRYHIKLLSINTIGFLESPNSDDRKIIKRYILLNEEYKKIFLESVNSRIWLMYLIEERELDKLLITRKSNTKRLLEKFSEYKFINFIKKTSFSKNKDVFQNLCFSLLIRHLPSNFDIILQYLIASPDFNNKDRFVFRILYYLKDWSDDRAYTFFEKYREVGNNDRHGYFKILEDIVDYRPEFVFNELRNELLQFNTEHQHKNSHDDYQIEIIVKKLLAKEPELTLDFLLEIITEKVKRNKYEGSVPSLNSDLLLHDYDRFDNHESGLEKYFALAVGKYEEFATSHQDKFLRVFNNQKDSSFESILRFLIYGLLKAPHLYSAQSFYLVQRFNKLNVFKERGRLQYHLRQLIRTSFQYFPDSQKEDLLNIILNIKDNEETFIYTDHSGKKKFHSHWGKSKFLYLSCLSEEFINSKLNAKKVYNELQRRKFQLDKSDKYYSKAIAGNVHAPLSKSAYDNMSLKNWYKSFLRYDSYEHNWGDNFLKGSIEEHSRAFSEEVKKRPDFFVDFIEGIIDDLKIHDLYIVRGIEGLKEAKYNPDRTLYLFKKLLSRVSKTRIINDYFKDNTRSLIWMAIYFIESKNIDEEVLNFLIVSSISHPDPANEREIDEDKIHIGINSVRGAAAHALTLITNSEFKTPIFDALFKIAEKDSHSVKAAIIYQLAYLMNFDKEKTLELFLLLMKDAHPKLYKPSIWTIQYLSNHDFNKLHSYFEKAIEVEEVQQDIAIILFHAWVRNEEHAQQLFERVLAKNVKCQGGAITVAFRNFYNDKGEPEKKYLKILNRYLVSNNKEIADAYNDEFLHAEKLKFIDLYPFLKKYSKSKVCKIPQSYFLEYLFKHAKTNPIECLKLLSNLNFDNSLENDYSTFIHEEAVKVVIGVYNSLRESDNSKRYTKKILDIIDNMLKQQKYRNEANKVIETVTI